ncbi:L,D-transpeptidase [Paracoccus sp. R12_1]|uniref:L,D-transpeptidase n=1 Tax=unclassified Paracoccus (in: a-proteobacteria) TaxID=2688777 RepID=UPI001ADA71C2|nr:MULTISPECIES: L,D-transpeptidase [unclassified Paracoccus (in: a-proteobacteria)]MBO9455407.1 L,D-transpeptidase [Paracoccus sp. R12_2]MBO9485887.1 L,D-transpeptidase [Paracoccus sp. R12_1]
MKRRIFLTGGSAAILAACAKSEPKPVATLPSPAMQMLPSRYGAIDDEPFPIPAVPQGVVPPDLWRQEVKNPYPDQSPGTVVVDPDRALLHLIQEDGMALRYGVGVGAAGFAWNGAARMQFKRKWPRWTPPDEMVARRPDLEPYSIANGGMDGGPDNPLGSRALYLFQNGKDTLYRIHGGCEPQYLGQAVSSGCIRLLDQDAIDIYERVPHGAAVVVLPSVWKEGARGIY